VGLAAGLALFCAAVTCACNAVLGIDSATVDQSLSDGGSGSSSGGTSDTGADAGTPCESYCATVMANCTGTNQEYLDVGTCLAMCQHFEPGVTGDTTQDSLVCRTYHAGAAATDPSFHCRHAGPVGGYGCGDDPCGPYCLLDFALCGDLASPPFPNESACRTACKANFTYLTADAGDISLSSGNTLNCRIYHLESAYEPDNPSAKKTHCPHTAVQSATCQ
jgi:hypothetical protein